MPFLSYLPTILIILGLAAVVFLAVRSILRDKKKGASCGCGCGCSSCPMAGKCRSDEQTETSE